MGFIKELEDDVINKIAAGEVVERPASVVKELVDNAIDAGSTKITVDLDQGGTKRITIIDNGRGMARDDAVLSVQRHATSKIKSIDDLMAINTMGFRGEALASIASVSEFVLQTQSKAGGEGTRISIDGGKGQIVDKWNGSIGTTITVSNLFFNLPARKAFLKSASSELAHCMDVVQSIALMRPGCEFVLINNDKEKLRVDAGEPSSALNEIGESTFRERAKQALRKDFVDDLIYVSSENQYGSIEALISSPGNEKPTPRHMMMFVNDRPVKDKYIRMGIIRGYHSYILKGQYPVVIISLKLNPSLVDVNVHPAKTEIRLQYASEIQSLIAMAIREKLRAGDWARPEGATKEGPSFASHFARQATPVIPAQLMQRSHSLSTMPGSSVSSAASSGFKAQPPRSVTSTQPSSFGFLGEHSGSVQTAAAAQQSDSSKIPWSELTYVGSMFSCYLVFDSRDKMLVIDQHALHERIIYERLLTDKKSWTMPQPMLVPEAIEIDPSKVENIRSRAERLMDFGFDLKIVGDKFVEWNSVPTILVGKCLEKLTHQFSLDDDELETEIGFGDESRLVLATIACHSAVRAGDELTQDQLTQLIAESHEVDFYHNCPHGRRVFKWWKKSEVEGWFDR